MAPPPRASSSRLTIVALALWGMAMALLDHPVLRDMGEFFTKAALLTFGGAYAALPYAYQGGMSAKTPSRGSKNSPKSSPPSSARASSHQSSNGSVSGLQPTA